MNETKKICILDTSAILTYIEDEDGSDYVENLLIDAVVHKDPEYEKLASEINEYRLPYKLSY